MTKAATLCGTPWRLENGGCAALPLPPDESIAAVARAQVRELLPTLGLTIRDTDDITVMVSELASNVLQHAMSGGSAAAELWVYRRSSERGDELVIKAFDTLRQWRRADRSDHGGGMAEHGRGLEIIDLLAGGRWGHHPSRSRLSSPTVRGKATWFALPVTRAPRGSRRYARGVAEQHALRELHTLLIQRGVGRLTPRSDLGVTVLSVPGELTVWCETATFRWDARSGETGKLPITDMTEVCEQLVRLHEAFTDLR